MYPQRGEGTDVTYIFFKLFIHSVISILIIFLIYRRKFCGGQIILVCYGIIHQNLFLKKSKLRVFFEKKIKWKIVLSMVDNDRQRYTCLQKLHPNLIFSVALYWLSKQMNLKIWVRCISSLIIRSLYIFFRSPSTTLNKKGSKRKFRLSVRHCVTVIHSRDRGGYFIFSPKESN